MIANDELFRYLERREMLAAMIRQVRQFESRAVGKDLEEKIAELQRALGIASPFKGETVIEKEKIIAETLKSGSTAANPKLITREDVEFILKEIF